MDAFHPDGPFSPYSGTLTTVACTCNIQEVILHTNCMYVSHSRRGDVLSGCMVLIEHKGQRNPRVIWVSAGLLDFQTSHAYSCWVGACTHRPRVEP